MLSITMHWSHVLLPPPQPCSPLQGIPYHGSLSVSILHVSREIFSTGSWKLSILPPCHPEFLWLAATANFLLLYKSLMLIKWMAPSDSAFFKHFVFASRLTSVYFEMLLEALRSTLGQECLIFRCFHPFLHCFLSFWPTIETLGGPSET